MQPTFPSDHHSHFLRRHPAQRGLRDRNGRLWSPADIATAAEHGIGILSRQVLPAFDHTDPRGSGHAG